MYMYLFYGKHRGLFNLPKKKEMIMDWLPLKMFTEMKRKACCCLTLPWMVPSKRMGPDWTGSGTPPHHRHTPNKWFPHSVYNIPRWISKVSKEILLRKTSDYKRATKDVLWRMKYKQRWCLQNSEFWTIIL